MCGVSVLSTSMTAEGGLTSSPSVSLKEKSAINVTEHSVKLV